MRIRQLKPTYYLDKTLWTECRSETREFYQALWLIADDDGWFEWDVTSIGAEVYRFVPVRRREREVERHAAILRELEPDDPHLVIHPCGHAQVPKMPQHQRISDAKKVTTDHRKHQRDCIPRTPAGTRGTPLIPVPEQERERVGNGRERDGKVGALTRENDDGTVSEFRSRIPRPGKALPA